MSDSPAPRNSKPGGTETAKPSTPTAADRYQIFEQVALEKLRSGSDQSKPVAFLPLPVRLSAITAVLISGLGVLWSVLARVPVQVNGIAAIIPEGAVSSALARTDGVLLYQVSGIGPNRLSALQQQRNQRLSHFWAQSVVGTQNTVSDAVLKQLTLDADAEPEGEALLLAEAGNGRLSYDTNTVGATAETNIYLPPNAIIARIDSPSALEELDAARRVTQPKLSLNRQIIRDREQRLAAYGSMAPMIQRQLQDKRNELADHEAMLQRLRNLWAKGYVSTTQLLQQQSTVTGLRQQLVQMDRDRLTNQFSGTDQRQQAKEAELNNLQTSNQLENALVTYMGRALTIVPPSGAYIVAVYQQNGMQVKQGDELFTYSLTPPILPTQIPVFVNATTVQQLDEGMQVLVTPKGISRAQYGGIPGVVTEIGRLPLAAESLAAVAGGRSLAASVGQATPTPYLVRVKLKLAKPASCRQHLSRQCYAWSTRRIPPFPVRLGSQADVQITTIYRRPIEFVMPALRQALGLVVENR